MSRIQGGALDPTAAAARLLHVRWLVRAPLFLYRHGTGWAFGRRMLMLEHRGRRSGEPRYVCLEVVDNPADAVFVVASGFGDQAQWFRNLQANGAAHVSIGRIRSAPAEVTFLDEDAAAWCLDRYRAQHPRAWKMLRGTIENASGRPVSEVPLIALSLIEDTDA